jgi:hypothetical protein
MSEPDAQPEGDLIELEEEASDVEDTEDGGALIKLDNENDAEQHLAHFANIVDEVDPGMLNEAVQELLEKIDKDKEAREKRDKQYEEGLRRTGLGDDAPGGAQFSGANKVVHPMLVEACVDFSARFMKEIFPPGGPVKSKIYGTQEKEKVDRARRKTEFMNWQAIEQMAEFRSELEQLSTQLPLGGGQYLKLMWNAQWKRPCSEFIAIDDIYLPFAATNFYSAERKTHVQYVTKMEFNRRVKSGMYREVDVGQPGELEFSKASRANDKIEGRKDVAYNEDGLRAVFEIYTHLDFDDGVEPYILSIDKSSGKALSLYRNWEPKDAQRKELEWIVEFPFVPWRGAYPIGLTHMIGGLSGAATGALRALLDSAHIQNIPTLLKLKGGPNGQTLNLQPTEVAEIEGGALVDDIRKLVMPMPFNQPSAVLFQLLGFLVDAGKGVVQTSFEKLSDQSVNQPVGTTLALIEQGMVVFSSIHSRLHNSMARAFKILHRINSAYLTDELIEGYDAGVDIKPEDFDGPLDVSPVSDPAIFSEAQRFAKIQALMQRAAMVPNMYDQRKIEEMFLETLKVPQKDVLTSEPGPVYVLPKQDHMAHIQTHVAFLKSPLFGMNPAITKTYLYPIALHLRDHLLNYYLTEAHEAVQKAENQQLIGDEAREQVKVILKVQQFIEQQLGGFADELAQLTQAAEQFKPQPPMPPDNTMQVAQLGAQVQQAAIQQRAQSDQARLAQQAQIEGQKLSENQVERDERLRQEQLRQMSENERTAAEIAARERMNTADNDTAMRLATAEIVTGEKFSVSTGGGINPGTR